LTERANAWTGLEPVTDLVGEESRAGLDGRALGAFLLTFPMLLWGVVLSALAEDTSL
jgi:hypothetical protein